MKKSTINEIRERFDNDVERFSNIETGQTSTIDARLSLELLTDVARRVCPAAENFLDIGCGAGNYSLKLLGKMPGLDCTLVDLSEPMLERACERITAATKSKVTVMQGDIRTLDFNDTRFDIILAGAVLHHLRDENDWRTTFKKLFELLKPGGCLLISDLISQEVPEINDYIREKYGEYLEELNGSDYRKKVFDYIEIEDSPRPLTFQLSLMKDIGFKYTEVLHKNVCFAAYCGVK